MTDEELAKIERLLPHDGKFCDAIKSQHVRQLLADYKALRDQKDDPMAGYLETLLPDLQRYAADVKKDMIREVLDDYARLQGVHRENAVLRVELRETKAQRDCLQAGINELNNELITMENEPWYVTLFPWMRGKKGAA